MSMFKVTYPFPPCDVFNPGSEFTLGKGKLAIAMLFWPKATAKKAN